MLSAAFEALFAAVRLSPLAMRQILPLGYAFDRISNAPEYARLAFWSYLSRGLVAAVFGHKISGQVHFTNDWRE